MTLFKVLSKHLLVWPEENHAKRRSGCPVSVPRSEPEQNYSSSTVLFLSELQIQYIFLDGHSMLLECNIVSFSRVEIVHSERDKVTVCLSLVT